MFAPFPGISPNKMDWRRIENVSSSPGSPLTGTQQVVSRPGGAWACTFEWNDLRDKYRHELMAWQSRLRGGAAHTWLSPYDRSQDGMPTDSGLINYAKNIKWSSVTTEPEPIHYVLNSTAGIDATTVRRAKVGADDYTETLDPGATFNSFARVLAHGLTACTFVAEYSPSAHSPSGTQVLARSRVSSSVNQNQFEQVNDVTDGPQRRVVSGLKAANGNIIFRTILQSAATSSFLGNSVFNIGAIASISVSSVAAAGSRNLVIEGIPVDLAGELIYREGEYIEIDGQLLRLVSGSVCSSAGTSMLLLGQPIRRALSAGALVNHYRPAAKMRILNPESGHTSRPYGLNNSLGTFSMSFVEVID